MTARTFHPTPVGAVSTATGREASVGAAPARAPLRRALLASLALALLALPAWADIALNVTADRHTVEVGETFNLTVETSGSGHAERPQIPKLKGLRIVGESRGTSLQIVTGTGGSSTQQTEVYTYAVEALEKGKHTIPPIAVHSGDEKHQSEPIDITVVAATPRQLPPGGLHPGFGPDPFDLFEPPPTRDLSDEIMEVRARTTKPSAYINEQITYVREVVRSYDPFAAELTTASLEGFHVADLPADRARREQREGREVVVEGRRVALFASASGDKTIDGGALVYRPGFGSATRTLDIPPVTVAILPLPAEGQPRGFEGAVGQWKVEAELDTHAVEVGEAVTLRIHVAGTGNVQGLPLPHVTLPPEIESYDPTVARKVTAGSDPVRGTLTAEMVLIPRAGGSFRVGPVRLPYFDPAAKQYRMAEASGGVLSVAGAPMATGPGATPRGAVEVAARDIHHVKSRPRGGLLAGSRFTQSPTALALQIIPLLAVAGVALDRWRRQRLESDPALARRLRARREADRVMQEARQAVRQGSGAEELVSAAVVGYVRDRLDLAPADLSGRETEGALATAGCAADLARRVRELLDECERGRYAPGIQAADKADALERAEGLLRELERANLTAGADRP